MDQKSLVDELGEENVTAEIGGNLKYDHTLWVNNRLVRSLCVA